MVAIFINVDVDESVRETRRSRSDLPRRVRSTSSPGTRAVASRSSTENLDECVLCYLCVEAAPEGTVRIIKLYE